MRILTHEGGIYLPLSQGVPQLISYTRALHDQCVAVTYNFGISMQHNMPWGSRQGDDNAHQSHEPKVHLFHNKVG